MEPTAPLKEYVEAKAGKLPRYYDSLLSVEVILDLEADKPVVEIVAQAKRRVTFVAKVRDDDMYACIDQCLDKIVRQLRRHKDRVRDRQGASAGETADLEQD
jgi:putative sigma-54 modulation protein